MPNKRPKRRGQSTINRNRMGDKNSLDDLSFIDKPENGTEYMVIDVIPHAYEDGTQTDQQVAIPEPLHNGKRIDIATDIGKSEHSFPEALTITSNESSSQPSDAVRLLRKRKSAKARLDYYFKYLWPHETQSTTDKIGICKLCQQNQRDVQIKMKNSNTTGLHKHMLRFHQAEYFKLNPAAKEIKKVKPAVETRTKQTGQLVPVISISQHISGELAAECSESNRLPIGFYVHEDTHTNPLCNPDSGASIKNINQPLDSASNVNSTQTSPSRIYCAISNKSESQPQTTKDSGTSVNNVHQALDSASNVNSTQPPPSRIYCAVSNNSKRQPQTPKGTRLENYFRYVWPLDKQSSIDKIGICRLCQQNQRDVQLKMKNSNTTGLHKHLSRYHQAEYLKLISTVKEGNKLTTIAKDGNKLTTTATDRNKVLIVAADVQKSQAKPVQKKVTASSFLQRKFDDLSIEWLAKKYLPFNFFDDEDTQEFFRFLNKQVVFPKRKVLQEHVVNYFVRMQQSVMKILQTNLSRISFSLDGWTSVENIPYYGITAHFIDENWTLQSLVLDFISSVDQCTGKDIANLFFKTIELYGITDKIQGITVDNVAGNTNFIEEFTKLYPNFIFKEIYIRCFAHNLDSGAQAVMALLRCSSSEEDKNLPNEMECEEDMEPYVCEIQESWKNQSSPLHKLWFMMKKIKHSELLASKFQSCCKTENVNFEMLVLDVGTRWNLTSDMIDVAITSQAALDDLCENNDEVARYRLVDNEWYLLKKTFLLLQNFKKFSTTLGGEEYVTLPMVIVNINLLFEKIESTAEALNQKNDRTILDEAIIITFKKSKDKMVKHYQKQNWLYCAVLLLDPRHRKETFFQTVWGKEIFASSVDKFESIYKELYYHPVEPEDNSSELQSSKEQVLGCFRDLEDLGLNILSEDEVSLTDTKQRNWKHELESYYATEKADQNTNILQWWSDNKAVYPCLSQMARDFLSTPATSVPSDRLFSRSSLAVQKQRNRLNQESARSLLCINSWVSCKLSKKIKATM